MPKIILDLCGGTGSWSRPYAEAGYDVRIIDPCIAEGRDVRWLKRIPNVHGILAAPPCTVFAACGARWQRSPDEIAEGLSVVDACLRIIFSCRPKWWAMENPIGTLVNYLGKPRMYFQPCDYGDPYTKKTCLWGDFREPERNPVEPEGMRPGQPNAWFSKVGGKSQKTKRYRSMTPPGFARAFFAANP